MIINHNIAALDIIRKLGVNQKNTQSSLAKLSSGLRINSAADDAAGLAISEKMRAQISGLDQASRNAQDSISMIQTGEGALNETQSILQRMRELAVQASNDTNTTDDRNEIQKEMNQLTSEINRIGNTTEFNTKKLLNGDFDFVAATAGKTTGNLAVASNVAITNQMTNGSVTGTTYASAGVGAQKATASSLTGNVVLSDSSTITAGINNELTLKVDDGTGKLVEHTITLTDGVSGASNIINDLNSNFVAGNVNAVATLEDQTNKIVITSKTLGSTGAVQVEGGGFADRYLVNYSSNTGQVTNRGNAGDSFKVTLEGSDGSSIDVVMTEDVSTASNTATRFAQGSDTVATASNLADALNKAIAANSKLAGKYEATVTGTGSDQLTIKAKAASDGYAISTFSTPVNTGGLAVGAGTASDVSNSVVSTTGTDVNDVWVHGDTAASVTGSVALDNSTLTSNIVNAYSKTTFAGTSGAGDIVSINLGGKTISLTGGAGPNSATAFVAGNSTDTTTNVADALNLAIAADDDLKNNYLASVESGSLVVKALDASGTVSALKVSVDANSSLNGTSSAIMSDPSIMTKSDNNELTFSLDGVDKTVNMDTKVYDGRTTRGVAEYSVTNFTAASTGDGDEFAIMLGGKTITLTGDSAGGDDATAFTFDSNLGTATDDATHIAKVLNQVIAADTDLAGKYTASSSGTVLMVKAETVDGTVSASTITTTTALAGTSETALPADTTATGTKAATYFYLPSATAVSDVFSLTLRDATDGTAKNISITGDAAISSETKFIAAGANVQTDAGAIATSLNLAIKAAGLGSQYTATAVNGLANTGTYIKIEATDTGSKYDVGSAMLYTSAGVGKGYNILNVDGVTNGVKASNTGTTVTGPSDLGDTFSVVLKGSDGVNKTLTLTATAGNNSATTFTDGATANETADNIRTALQMAIDADWRMAGRYNVSGTNAQVEITATDEGSSYAVGAMSKTGTMTIGGGGGTQTAGQTGQTSKGLQLDLQAQIDAEFKSTVTDAVTGIASTGDKYSISLEGYDGNMVNIDLTAAGANSVTTFQTTGTTNGVAANIANALTQAIAANSQLAGRFTATNDGSDNIVIQAAGFGEGSKIEQSSETQVAVGSIFAVTNGAASDERTLSVSLDSGNDMVLTSNRTDTSSSVNVTGSNLADTLFGAVTTRQTMDRQAANNSITFDVDGASKTVNLTNQTYQDLDEFVSVNSAAFVAAGVTASNNSGVLKLTSMSTGADSDITNIQSSDAAKQLGLVKNDGTVLDAGNFIQGADGNTVLHLKIDGEEVSATIQEGNYSDRNLLASAVQSAINNATTTAADVNVTVNDQNQLVITSGSTGTNSKIEILSDATHDAAGALGLAANDQQTGAAQTAAELTFQTGSNMGQTMSIQISDMRAAGLNVSGTSAGGAASVAGATFTATKDVTNGTDNVGAEYALDVSDTTKASAAIKVLDNALTMVSAERSRLGAYQNRLEHTINNLGTASENLSSAESRIRDVDMASEMSEFTKNNILSQAAQAMLAQANQQPQGVLQLLR